MLLAEDGGHFDEPQRGVAYWVTGKAWVNNHAHVIRPGKTVDWRYLGHVLRNYDVRPYVTGSTRGKLTQAAAARMPIPLPPLSEQRRIAAILDRVDALRAKRRRTLTLLDDLPQAVFARMFGGVEVIMDKWPTVPLGDLLTFLTSGSRGWARYYAEEGDLFLRIQNVGKDRMLLDDVALVEAPHTAEARRTKVEAGDVLLSITADLGRTAVVPETIGRAFINQHLSILRVPSLEPRYLSAFLASGAGQRQVQGRNRQAVKAGLNFDDIRSISIPVPPMDEQRAFAQAVAMVECKRAAIDRGASELGALVASLQGRAFSGAGSWSSDD